MNDNIKYYCAFSYLNFSPLFKAKLFEYFNYDIKRCFLAQKSDLEGFNDFCDVTVPNSFFSKKEKLNPDECLKKSLTKEIKILTYEDDKYPPLLKEIPDFPLSLFYLGDLSDIDYSHIIAVVGSRRATGAAKGALNSIISGLNNTDIIIVSGLAYGIDAQAHQSAIDNNLKTIAVIGTGLDIQYPAQNKKLYDDIINSKGIIFSEYPVGVQPEPYHFPQRNRIVTGMSKGTLVAEAQIKSGAMISANLTLDYNRELMCMPGNILNPNTSGIYHLIKNGASIVTTTDDLLNNLDWDIIHSENKKPEELNNIQSKILNVIALEDATFDKIVQETGEEIPEIMVSLTELELKGLIKQSNNRYYKNK